MLDYILLGLLYGCSMTGYELKKAAENGVGVFYRAGYGSIYPALKKLAGKGWITPLPDEEGGRGKKAYAITPAGQLAFMEWLSQPVDFADANSRQLVKIYFYDRLPPATRRTFLQDFELYNRAYLHRLEALRAELDTPENRREHYFKLSTLYYGICITQATLGWCTMIQEGGAPDAG